nr:MAG TPA: hypothetical protein [Caudoviricetes sp.]
MIKAVVIMYHGEELTVQQISQLGTIIRSATKEEFADTIQIFTKDSAEIANGLIPISGHDVESDARYIMYSLGYTKLKSLATIVIDLEEAMGKNDDKFKTSLKFVYNELKDKTPMQLALWCKVRNLPQPLFELIVAYCKRRL